MHIVKIYEKKRPVISFEIFPPKKGNELSNIDSTIEQLSKMHPDFISVTCGAGGTGSNQTIEIASMIKKKYGLEALAHLTCIASNKESIQMNLESLQKSGVENILALRGDLPPGHQPRKDQFYRYAVDLIQEIHRSGYFCVGAAAYPEGHIECEDEKKDLDYLRKKIDAGVDFFITQLFFDNEIFYRFREKLTKQGIYCKVSAGIMPILNKKQIEKMIFMCGASLPSKVIRLLVKYENHPEDLRRFGIEYAAEQSLDLLNEGVDGIHIYTMNQPEIAKEIISRLPISK